MKAITTFLACLVASALFSQSNINQTLSVNGSGAAADPSAQLDISANNKGMLVPRMTSLERAAIPSPVNGLLVYDTSTNSFWHFNGTAWANLATPKTLQDADGNTKVQVEKNPNEDIIRFDLGGTENMVLRKNAGGTPRLEFPGTNTFMGTNAGSANTASHNSATGRDALFSNTTGSSNSAFGSGVLRENTSGADNVAVGKDALFDNTSGSNNTAVGVLALFKNTTANHNSAFGRFALANTTTGSFNVACGSLALVSNTTGYSNVAVGRDALNKNTTRSNLVAVGDSALFNNGVGVTLAIHATSNTALGSKALFANTTGSDNTASGNAALRLNTTGTDNTASGSSALAANTTGGSNTASGSDALAANTSGNFNTASGRSALIANTTGGGNTASGFLAMAANTSGNFNVALGSAALYANTVRSNLVAVGDSALYNNGIGASGTQATFNTALGSKALFANTTGEGNTAAGKDALRSNTDGNFNTAYGLSALFSNTTGTFNTASGWNALYFNQGGFANTAFGPNTLGNNTAGSYNAASGDSALGNNSTGSSNTAQGVQALSTNTTGSNNTALGAQADVTANNLSNATAIGFNAKVGASNSLVLGGTGADAVNVGIGTQTPGHPLHLDAVGTGFAHTAGGIVLTTFADPGYSPAGAWIGTVSNHPLHFFADNPAAPQMTLTQNGDLGIGTSTVPAGIRLQVEGNIATPSGNSVYVGGVTNNGDDGLRMHQTAGGSYIDHKGAGDLLFRADNTLGGTPRMTIRNNGNVGIGRNPVTNLLEVEGDASKSSAGDWLANSDARLKKNIQPLNSQLMLQSLLALRGVTYEWNDDKTGSKRPEGIQYGFTAQNIREVFPTLVEEDKLGYLQTAYGTYDAMTVEAIRALNEKIGALREENGALKSLSRELGAQLEKEQAANASQAAQLDRITAALAGAGIAVEK